MSKIKKTGSSPHYHITATLVGLLAEKASVRVREIERNVTSCGGAEAHERNM